MSNVTLSPKDIHDVLEELCLTRSSITGSDFNGMSPSTSHEEDQYQCPDLDMLMPRIVSQKTSNFCSDISGEETGTSKSPNRKSKMLDRYIQTHSLGSDSKISQTTFGSSIMLYSDSFSGQEELESEETINSSTQVNGKSPRPFKMSNKSANTGSNTDTLHCWKHPYRCYSRRSKSHTPSKMYMVDSIKERIRVKNDKEFMKKSHRISNIFPHKGLHETENTEHKDALIDSNTLCNVNVYQNVATWSRSPFMPAEKEFKHNTINQQLSKELSASVHLRNTSNKENRLSTGTKECLEMKSWTYGLNPLLKGDIISNLDKCFQTSEHISWLQPRSSRSDSAVTVSKYNDIKNKGSANNKVSRNCSKTGKPGKPTIYWAITKINIYPDNSRTYEVMPLTGKKPAEVPQKSDSIFVLIPPIKNTQTDK